MKRESRKNKETSPSLETPRLWLQFGVFGLLTGIAMSAVDMAAVGAWVVVGSAVGLLFGIHRFGRLGPDRPTARRARESRK